MASFYIPHNHSDAIVENHLNKFQQRTGCFVEYATIFGSSIRGYGVNNSDRDVGFVFDYPNPTTLTIKDNIKFKVGDVEFIGTSRKFFLDKLGSGSVHHWLVFLADASRFLIDKSENYGKFRRCFMTSRSMRDHIARRFLHSGTGQMRSVEHNLVKNYALLRDDEEFCAAIKYQLQAIYTVALGLILATDQPILSNDILVLLGMTELGRTIVPDAERLIRLRRSVLERENYLPHGWTLPGWEDEVLKYANTIPTLMYEGETSPYASQYDPQEETEFNILEGRDNTIRRTIVECFYEKG